MTAPELIYGLLAWSLATVFVLTVAFLLIPLVRSGRPSLDVLAFLFMFVFCASAFVLATGLLGQFRRDFVALISVLGLAVIAVVPAGRARVREFRSSATVLHANLRVFWNDLPTFLKWITIVTVVAGLARFAFLIIALPPFVWDSLTYHLTNVAHWTQTGRIEVFETSVQRIYTPANYELLASWFTVFLQHDAFVEAAGLPAYVLAGLAVYASSRYLGAGRAGAWSGALAYAFTPALLIAVTGTKNDPHMAAYYLTGVAIILDLKRRNPPSKDRSALSRLSLLLLVLMLAAGTKAYLIHMLPGLAVLWIANSGIGSAIGDTRTLVASAAKEFTQLIAQAKAALLVLFVVGAILAGYWNIRNWVMTGNPFYPYGVEVGETQVLLEGNRSIGFDLNRLTANLASLGDRYGDRVQPVTPDLPNTTGWGWFFYALGVPAIFWGLVRCKLFRPVLAGFAVSFLLLEFSIRPSPFNTRYLIWFPALGAMAWSVWADRIPVKPRIFTFGFWGIYAACLGLNLLMTANYGIVSADKFGLMLERGIWDRQSSTLKLNMPSEYENALVEVPEDELLGYQVHSNGFIYPLYQAGFEQRLVYVPIKVDDGCETIADRMLERGTRYLFVAQEHTADSIRERVESCSNLGSRIEFIAEGVYRVTEPS